MWKIRANKLLPKALKSCPKSNKSPNLVALVTFIFHRSLFLLDYLPMLLVFSLVLSFDLMLWSMRLHIFARQSFRLVGIEHGVSEFNYLEIQLLLVKLILSLLLWSFSLVRIILILYQLFPIPSFDLNLTFYPSVLFFIGLYICTPVRFDLISKAIFNIFVEFIRFLLSSFRICLLLKHF